MSNSSCCSQHVAVYFSPMTLKGVDAVGRGKKRGRRAPVGKEIRKKQFKMKMMQISHEVRTSGATRSFSWGEGWRGGGVIASKRCRVKGLNIDGNTVVQVPEVSI